MSNVKILNNETLSKMANSIRFLSIHAVCKANSGHPGMPLGASDIVTALFANFLQFNPKDPKWHNRDRFVLSAGHGSAMLYSLLYLCGYGDISLDDIKSFRSIHSKTAGHPEYGFLSGIECTTGPLGQGFANAVGMAIAEKTLSAKLGSNIINNNTYVLVGDGCLAEGISYEAMELAGHLGLNKLIALYDSNEITIDGSTSLASSSDVIKRFEASGWSVLSCDGHNFDQINNAILQAKNSEQKPTIIVCKTKIGYGSPKQASEDSHGSPLSLSEIEQTAKNLNWNYGPFEIPSDILSVWRGVYERCLDNYNNSKVSVDGNKAFGQIFGKDKFDQVFSELSKYKSAIFSSKKTDSTRKLFGDMLEILNKHVPSTIAGSADLAKSNCVINKESKPISKSNFDGNFIHYGIREHAMAAIMNGISLSGLLPFGGTFLVFSDYMRPSIRLSALMGLQVVYVLTHDSIALGEDGPTHQPIEHIASLRLIPNLNVFRPCDAIECVECLEIALHSPSTPSIFALTRQKVSLERQVDTDKNLSKQGIYKVYGSDVGVKIKIIASGSEVSLAREVAKKLIDAKIPTEAFSAPCLEIFDKADVSYKNLIIGDSSAVRVFIEAGKIDSFFKYSRSSKDMFFGIDEFGLSGKAEDVYDHFGLTVDKITAKILKNLEASLAL